MRKRLDYTKSYKQGLSLLYIIVGNILISFAYSKWMIPNEFINGGVTGVSMILNKFTTIPIPILTNVVTVFLLVISLLNLGAENATKSIFGSVMYMTTFPLMMSTAVDLTINPFVDLILACIFIATGGFLCIISNASTVSVDVIAIIIKKKRPEYSLPKLIRFGNIIVLSFGVLSFGIFKIIIGIIFSILYSKVLEFLFETDYLRTFRDYLRIE